MAILLTQKGGETDMAKQELNSAQQDKIILTAPKPFHFAQTLRYLTRSPHECMFHVEHDKIYRLLNVEGQSVIVEISGDDNALTVRLVKHGAMTAAMQVAIVRYVRDWFDFDRDLKPFYAQVAQCPLLGPLARQYAGLRIIGVPDLFEALCWAISGQQINLAFAYTLKRRLVESFGAQETWNQRSYWLFPTAKTVSQLDVRDLTALQFTQRKAEYLLEIAAQIRDGALSKDGLLALGDFKKAEQRLLQIRGIGPWTANYVMMRCLRNPAAFPVADVGLQNAVKARLGTDEKPTPETLQILARAWSGWEAYATFYLWQSLYHTA